MTTTVRRCMRSACGNGADHTWCSLTCPRSTSKPSKVMGSASPGSVRNNSWIHRSRSVCSPTLGVPAHDRGVRGQQSRDDHVPAIAARLPGGPSVPGSDGGGGYRHALGMANCAPYRGPDYGSSSARRSPMCPMRWFNGWPSILIRIRPMGWCWPNRGRTVRQASK